MKSILVKRSQILIKLDDKITRGGRHRITMLIYFAMSFFESWRLNKNIYQLEFIFIILKIIN